MTLCSSQTGNIFLTCVFCCVRIDAKRAVLYPVAVSTHNSDNLFFLCSVLVTDFITARCSYASAVFGVVILSVHLSVCHMHALWLTQRTCQRYFYSTWKGNPSVVDGRRPFPSLMGDRSDPPPFKNRSRRQISTCNVSTVRASEKKFNYDE